MLIALCNGQSQDAIVIADGFSVWPSPVKEPVVGRILHLSVEPSRQLQDEWDHKASAKLLLLINPGNGSVGENPEHPTISDTVHA